MTTKAFSFARTPAILFGPGKLDSLVGQILKFGKTPLMLLSGSFRSSSSYKRLMNEFVTNNLSCEEFIVKGEPTPAAIDGIVAQFKDKKIDVIVAIGGGSALDTGKAVSAMIHEGYPTKDYLEGMEARRHSGKKLPFIAIPTTAGTGSEATKNSVISEVGPGGFKRSLRHDHFVPDIAIIDPELTLSCPADVTAACGLDALTQLIEAYVSTEASPVTDALALSGLQHFYKGYKGSFENGKTDLPARTNMAYASLISGIVLASSGLGTVHGFASSIGGFYQVPHGVICGTLLGEVTELVVKGLLAEEETHLVAVKKYANLGRILTGIRDVNDHESCLNLVKYLKALVESSGIPRLGQYGIHEKDIDKIVSETGNKNSPLKLNTGQLKQSLKNRI